MDARRGGRVARCEARRRERPSAKEGEVVSTRETTPGEAAAAARRRDATDRRRDEDGDSAGETISTERRTVGLSEELIG
jgi:hypothetical protein